MTSATKIDNYIWAMNSCSTRLKLRTPNNLLRQNAEAG